MAWSPSQYVKFEDERTRPARDLLAQVPLDTVTRGIDLGCGPGNSTELLVARWGAAGISGLDSDAAMIEAARKRLSDVSFEIADLATWRPSEPVDLLFANAVFQWLPDHLDIFGQLMDGLRPGGVLSRRVGAAIAAGWVRWPRLPIGWASVALGGVSSLDGFDAL